jgi:uncharacterized Zn finger protein (UPF0148 family)
MRCNNCGWDNSINQSHCEKCKVPLQGASVSARPPEPAEVNAPICGTIKGAAADQPYLDTPADNMQGAVTEDAKIRYCTYPGCGYPLLPGSTVCPKCNTPVEPNPRSQAGPPPNSAVPGKKGSSATGTINPYIQAKADYISLQPLVRDGEKSLTVLEFSGKEITLNRENLESGNLSITGKVQAELKVENGKWFLQDKSAMHTTFLLVSQPTEIRNGDIILMGDRLFKVEL